MIEVATLYALALVVSGIYIAGHVAAARAIGVHIRCVSFGYAPVLFRRQRGDVLLRLGLLPGGFVEVADRRFTDTVESVPDGAELAGKHRLLRVALALAGSALLLACAAAIHGADGVVAAGVGMWQLVEGALRPTSVAHDHIEAIVAAVRHAGLVDLFGLACAKIAAFNLLPVPGFSGGRALGELAGKLDYTPLALIGAITTMALAGLWGVALVSYLL